VAADGAGEKATPAIQSCPCWVENPKALGLGRKAENWHCSVCRADFGGGWLHLGALRSGNVLHVRMVEELVLQRRSSMGFCSQLLLWTNVMQKS